MIYIESAWNDGYIAHHAKDMIYIVIVHRPEDGYLLTANKQVIKERLELKEFLIRLAQVERKVSSISVRDIDTQILEIQHSLRLGKHREIAKWLDYRYAWLIRNKELVLAQHSYSYYKEIEERERVQEWNQRAFQKELDRQGLKIKEETSDEDVYYLITS